MATTTKSILIYVIRGSQFSAKVLAALDSRKIEHYCYFVSLDESKRKKELPSGGILVPEMKITTGKEDGKEGGSVTNVKDSEKILHWFDENMDTKFFPNQETSDLSVRVSDHTLAAFVYYYNWVNDAGFERSMRAVAVSAIGVPTWVPFGPPLVGYMLSSHRKKFVDRATTALKGASSIDNFDPSYLDDETKMYNLLMEELKYVQSFLKDDADKQPYLIAGCNEPTAADFSVYVQMERLVGDSGDAKVPCALPSLMEDEKDTLQRLWTWYSHMRESHPIQFMGKRIPTGQAKL